MGFFSAEKRQTNLEEKNSRVPHQNKGAFELGSLLKMQEVFENGGIWSESGQIRGLDGG